MPLPPPPEISNKTTQVEMDPVSCLCSSQHPTNVMTGVVTRLLQEHFANVNNLIYTDKFDGRTGVEEMIWSKDRTLTKIQIDPVWLYNAEDIQRRPAIYVKRNTWTTQRLGIADGYTINASKTASGEIGRVRGEYKSRAVLGSHTIFAVGRTGAEAELIGSEVFDFLLSFSPILRSDLSLHRMEVTEIGPVSMLDESSEHFVVPVTLAYAAMWAWRLEMISPWLQKLSIDSSPAKC